MMSLMTNSQVCWMNRNYVWKLILTFISYNTLAWLTTQWQDYIIHVVVMCNKVWEHSKFGREKVHYFIVLLFRLKKTGPHLTRYNVWPETINLLPYALYIGWEQFDVRFATEILQNGFKKCVCGLCNNNNNNNNNNNTLFTLVQA